MGKALEKRWNHWDDLENDPRWNAGSFRNKCALPRAEDQVEIKMPPAYADIFNSGTDGGETGGDIGSPPAYYSNTPSPQETSAPPPKVVVQVATPPPAGPVKKTYRKVKKTPVVPKPEDQ